MTEPIHIVAPTLTDQTGHCFSHLHSLVLANRRLALPLHAWVGKKARDLFRDYPEVIVHPRFRRPWRRIGAFWLYRHLLRQPGRLYLPTASRTDVLLLAVAAAGLIPESKAFLLFHWLKLSPVKKGMLTWLARRQPHLVTMGPSAGVVEALKTCGFPHARLVPYPITPLGPAGPETAAVPPPFRHLLFAGAARADKGFPLVVELVEQLARQRSELPVVVQVSPPHNGRHDAATVAALGRLAATPYPGLRIRDQTLLSEEYFALFRGAICLQPYNAREYARDRISGVTLDALSAGCPIVTTAGTWMARLAARFQAGLAVDAPTVEALFEAVSEMRDRYPVYAANAARAGQVLQQENSAAHILEFIAGYPASAG